MLEAIIAFGVMAGVAAALALSTGYAVALLAWLTISAIACSLAALAMQSQPLDESTPMGRVGGLLVRWGFEVGQGQLFPALAISWFIWALLGAAVISLIGFRSDRISTPAKAPNTPVPDHACVPTTRSTGCAGTALYLANAGGGGPATRGLGVMGQTARQEAQMITVLTTFTLPKPITREEARSIFLSTAPKYRGVQGLLRKIYLLSQDGITVGGVYLWNSRPEAEAMYTESWRSFVREKYGTDPTVTYFESPVVVDNVAQQVLTDE